MLVLRNRSAPNRRRRAIGAAVLLVAIAAAWLGIAQPDPFAHDEVVHVMFDHVQGMALVQRHVRVAGVNVGTIGAVRRVGTHAEVELRLHQQIPVYRDATAALRPHTPFEGTTFIDLRPGTPAAGPLGTAPIPISHSTVFVSVGEVLSTFDAPVRRSFQVIVAELARALEPPGQIGISTALHNAPALTRQAEAIVPAMRGPHLDELRTLLPPLSATIDALAGQDDELRSVVHNAARTLGAIAADGTGPLDRTLSGLPAAMRNAREAARRSVTLLDRADSTAVALVPTLQQVPATLAPLTRLLDRSDPVLRALPPLVSNVAGTLQKFGGATPALLRLFATLRPAAALLSSQVLPFLTSRSPLGLPVYLQLIASVAGYTGSMSSFVTGRQINYAFPPAPLGHGMRSTLQGPFTLPLEALNSPIPCAAIAKLNPKAVPDIQALGLCSG